jgi:hypothetical protein
MYGTGGVSEHMHDFHETLIRNLEHLDLYIMTHTCTLSWPT